MKDVIDFFAPYIYGEVFVAILVITELFKYMIPLQIHAKWQTFWIAIVVVIVDVVIRWGDIDIWKAVISFALATLSYDYAIKPIKDRFWPEKR